MTKIIENIAILIFGDIENWNNYRIINGNKIEIAITTIIKYTPQILAITLLILITSLFIYFIWKGVKAITK